VRAARVDLVVETSTTFRRAFRYEVPDPVAVNVETLQPGDRVFFDRTPWPVHAVRIDGTKVTLEFGSGRFIDPLVETVAGRQAHKAIVAVPTSAVAKWAAPDTTETPAVSVVEIPTTIDPDGTVILSLSVEDTEKFAQVVDSHGWGPSGFSAPWDLLITLADSTVLRLVEGRMSVIRSTSTELQEVTP
jgi:hypothetical protein